MPDTQKHSMWFKTHLTRRPIKDCINCKNTFDVLLKYIIFEMINGSSNFEAKNVWSQNKFEKYKYL